MNAQCPHKWWSTCLAIVRIRLVLLSWEGGVVWSVSRSGRQKCCWPILMESSRPGDREDSADLPSTCHPSPSLTTFSFRPQEVIRLLLMGLDSYGGTDQLGMFPLFLRGLMMLWPIVSLWYFGGSFVWVAFLLAEEWLSLQFQRVHLLPHWPITDKFL